MAFTVNKGQTNYNPRIITEGLIFYTDPSNRFTRSVPGFVYKDLTNAYTGFTNLCAGNLISHTDTLSFFNDNYYINLNSPLTYLSGNIGPNNSINFLDNYTIQFWFKNNSNNTFKKFFTTNSFILCTTEEGTFPAFEPSTGGFCLSGESNLLTFKPQSSSQYNVSADSFSTSLSGWNCVTLAQNNKISILYKNGSRFYTKNNNINTFNLSGIAINGDITLGQIFIYNRYLTPKEVKVNYDSFKSRYRVDEVFNYSDGTMVYPLAIGGVESTYNKDGRDWKVHTFFNNDTFTILEPITGVRYIIVAGGGGSNNDVSGGGGAGGYIERTNESFSPGTNLVMVGSGGIAGYDSPFSAAQNGGRSVFNNLTAVGGGAGGRWQNVGASSGGSGGGGGGGAGAGGNGTTNQGFSGGTANQGLFEAGGGGGAGQIGRSSSQLSNGGAGLSSDITGSNTFYAGGGAGGRGVGAIPAIGGVGGGGNGQNRTYATVNVTSSIVTSINGLSASFNLPFHGFKLNDYFYLQQSSSLFNAFKVREIIDIDNFAAVRRDLLPSFVPSPNMVLYRLSATDGLDGFGAGAGGTGGREPMGRFGGSGIVVISYPIPQ